MQLKELLKQFDTCITTERRGGCTVFELIGYQYDAELQDCFVRQQRVIFRGKTCLLTKLSNYMRDRVYNDVVLIERKD